MDRALIESSWLSASARRCLLLGASIGSWRALAFAARDPMQAHAALVEHYVTQHFTLDDAPSAISHAYEQLLRSVFSEDDIAHALGHPAFDLAIIAARARHPGAAGARGLQTAMLGAATLLNALHPRLRSWFFERVVFENRANCSSAVLTALQARHGSLTQQNLRAVALASGTVPLYMEPVRDIPSAPPGAYIDGSITDYHVGQRVSGSGGVALLFLHQSKVVPGWLDKFIPWRHAAPSALEDVLLVHPDREFVRSLPLSAVPSRKDFERFVDRPEERLAHWREVVTRGQELGAAFMRDVASNAIASRAQPL
jgi:hypothetical protein